MYNENYDFISAGDCFLCKDVNPNVASLINLERPQQIFNYKSVFHGFWVNLSKKHVFPVSIGAKLASYSHTYQGISDSSLLRFRCALLTLPKSGESELASIEKQRRRSINQVSKESRGASRIYEYVISALFLLSNYAPFYAHVSIPAASRDNF
jgi:hypothetical protein